MRRFLTLAAVTAGLFSAPLLPGGSPAVAGDGGANLQYVPGQVLIGYKNTAASFAKASAVSRVGGRVLEVIQTTAMMDARQRPIELAQVSIPVEQAIQILKSDPNVAYAEPNWIVRHSDTNDPYYTNGSLWGMYGDATSKVNQYGSQAGEAWHRNSGSKNVVVGVIDEGIDISHPDLKDNIWVNPLETVNGIDDDGNGYVDDINGWDFVNNDRTVYDGGNQDKHGTHVAGTIGAKGGNGVGVVGVNWSVTIVSLKFLGRNGGTLANAIKAIDYLTTLKNRQGIRVVASNNSWSGGGYSQSLADAITRAQNAGILFVAAAGNGGNDGVGDNNDTTPTYPASYTHSNVIAVMSITSSGARSSFSNYGVTSVDLGAPGSGIYSTLPKNSYGSYSGTSMAAPHVTGAAALFANANANATWSDIKNAIMGSTVATSSLSGRCVTGGRLNCGEF